MSRYGQFDLAEHSSVTRADVKALRREARAAGDEAMVRTCDAALDRTHDTSQMAAWARCEKAIAEAQAAAS
ncbi:MAG TPA: hypothetical protein PLT35_13270 [Vicinamibacterales bacterium]|nr:hypothetical protein [Vicinamibacterales bacterium]